MAVVASLTACDLMGGGSGDRASTGPLEQPSINVLVLPTLDSVPFWVAQERGYFAAEGLQVTELAATSGPATVTALVSGNGPSIGIASYPAFFAPQAKGVGPLVIVADGLQAGDKFAQLLGLPDGPIKTPADIAGRKIGVSGKGTISDLGIMSALQAKGVPQDRIDSIKWVEVPFKDMQQNLKDKNVDAVLAIEPWMTQLQQALGASTVLELFTAPGPDADLALSGWGATRKWVSANPRTATAFQRALARGASDAQQDRGLIDTMAVKHAKTDPKVAALMHPGTFPISLDPKRLQRPADLMNTFAKVTGLAQRLDVEPMIWVDPSRSSATGAPR